MLKETIGKFLRFRRNELNLSSEEVVNELESHGFKITTKTLYNWENGIRQPNADTFLILCKIYKIENVLQYFGFSSESKNATNQFTKNDEKIIKKYHELDDRGKEAVLDTLEREHKHVEPKIKDAAM